MPTSNMPERTIYDPVPDEEGAAEDDANGVEPLELDLQSREPQRDDRLFSFKDPWLPTTGIVYTLMVPALLGAILMVFELTGRVWPAFLFSLHLMSCLWLLATTIPSDDLTIPPPSICRRIVSTALDVFLFANLYPKVCSVLINDFFTDMDGTTVVEYSHYKSVTGQLRFMGIMIGLSRFLLEAISICIICYYRRFSVDVTEHPRFPSRLATSFVWWETEAFAWSEHSKARLRRSLRWITYCMLWISVFLLIWSTTSVIVHWGNWSAPKHSSSRCDPLDNTECVLPFPSYHLMAEDETSATGWRVNLNAEVLPRLKGGIKLHPEFLNELDGFSTMAPILFYVEGMKEAHQQGNNEVRLQGARFIENSVTPKSITLLLDVDNKQLVHHTAEIDFLDNDLPLVLLFPSQPLRHNAHYAVIVAGAGDANGDMLSPTPGMSEFLLNEAMNATTRHVRYRDKIVPALGEAAPWIDLQKAQLTFDFPTISEESQLGPIKAVRDATLNHIDSEDWKWKKHVHVVRVQNQDCSRADTKIARTVHAKLDVPWFLQAFGVGHRAALLNKESVANGKTDLIGKAHFVVHIPCSIRAAAIRRDNAKNLRAFVEFGHGLFYNRNEASMQTLVDMANDNGYVIMAMDWRGMSSYDLLVVIKTLMAKPSMFQAIRDNLIQGYANKLALQHFAKYAMLSMNWMHFGVGLSPKKPIPIYDGQPPQSIFYGISQGGILGAGYTTLLGPTKLIDRGVLGVPGTPFALIMSRSLEFAGYDIIMLLNFYNNRHVRIFLSFAQMLWDSCEGSGLLAPPQLEERPRMLLQAGLGDPVVPTIAAEALTRALGGKTLPSNPRKIFGVAVGQAASDTSLGPDVTLAELLYKKENASLPVDDKYADVEGNNVHVCVRRDETFVRQLEEFINTGRVLDVCENNGCVRESANC